MALFIPSCNETPSQICTTLPSLSSSAFIRTSWSSHTSTWRGLARTASSNGLERLVEGYFNRTADLQGADSRPDPPLALENPICQALLAGCLEKLREILQGEIGDHGEVSTRDGLFDQKPAESLRQEAEVVELAESMAHFGRGETHECPRGVPLACLSSVEEIRLGTQKGYQVGSSLRDDKVVDVE